MKSFNLLRASGRHVWARRSSIVIRRFKFVILIVQSYLLRVVRSACGARSPCGWRYWPWGCAMSVVGRKQSCHSNVTSFIYITGQGISIQKIEICEQQCDSWGSRNLLGNSLKVPGVKPIGNTHNWVCTSNETYVCTWSSSSQKPWASRQSTDVIGQLADWTQNGR